MPVLSGTQYAQRADLANLGLIGGVLASIPTATQDAALLAASGVADGFLQARYLLPLTQWGQDLVRVVCIIAAYDLLTGKGYNPAAGADQNVRGRYLDALEWLKEVSKQDGPTPAYVIDSSTTSPGSTATPPADGSTVFTTSGAFQAQTDNPRGWTDRGGSAPPVDSGSGPL